MAALTAARLTKSRGGVRLQEYPVLAATTIYAGSMVMIDSAGYAVPAAAAAGNKGVIGVAAATIDNSAGANGALNVSCQEGEFLFDAGTLAQSAVAGLVYAQDDQTMDETQGANEPLAGQLSEFVSATSGWVRIGLDMIS